MPLEQYLTIESHIVVGHIIPTEQHFKASFISGRGTHQRVVSVQSQRKAEHLFLLLEAAITDDEAMRIDAERVYPYPISWGEKEAIDHLLAVSYVHIYSSKDGQVDADCFQFMASIKKGSVPGLFKRSGMGTTVWEALSVAARSNTFHRVTCVPVVLYEKRPDTKEQEEGDNTDTVVA